MTVSEFIIAKKLITGKNGLKQLKSEVERLKMKRPLIVTDEILTQIGTVNLVEKELSGVNYQCYTGVKPEPEMGRIIAKGTISDGTPIACRTGFNNSIIKSIAPEARKTEIATSIPTKYGMIEIAIPNPSFAPSTKVSYVGTCLYVPYIRTKAIKTGMNQMEITVIHPIYTRPFLTRL